MAETALIWFRCRISLQAALCGMTILGWAQWVTVRSSTSRLMFREERYQSRAIRHDRQEYVSRPRLPRLRRCSNQGHPVRPSGRRGTRYRRIQGGVLQRFQYPQLRPAIEYCQRQRLWNHQQDSRYVAADSVFPQSDLLTRNKFRTLSVVTEGGLCPCGFIVS